MAAKFKLKNKVVSTKTKEKGTVIAVLNWSCMFSGEKGNDYLIEFDEPDKDGFKKDIFTEGDLTLI
jgi:hypothetical protein